MPMSEPAPSRFSDRGDLPPALPLAPGSDPLPDSLAEPGDVGPAVVLLMTTADPVWAADTAIAIAASWARAGRRVVLADLQLEEPVLHERVGAANQDGMVDVFLYGASLARSARPVAGRSFYLIPAGTYTADAGQVYRHPRWAKLIAGFRDADAVLLLFVNDRSADAVALAEWAEDVVVLGDPAESRLLASFAARGVEVRAVVVPPSPDPTGSEPSEPDPAEPIAIETVRDAVDQDAGDPGDEADREDGDGHGEEDESEISGWADVVAPSPDAGYPLEATRIVVSAVPPAVKTVTQPLDDAADSHADPDPDPAARPEAPGLETARPLRRRARRSERTLVGRLLGAAAAVVVVVAAVALLLPDRGSTAEDAVLVERPVAAADDAVSPEPAPAPIPAPTPQPYAVQLGAFTTLAAARAEIAAEQPRYPDVPFYISPERNRDVLYYKVRAGLLADSAAANRLRERLVEGGAIEPEDAAGAWSLIQYAPLAFSFGEYGTREAAALRGDSLEARGVPAYLVRLPAAGDAERWRVYGGAFRDSTVAGGMRELLGPAGIDAPLRPREGMPSTMDG